MNIRWRRLLFVAFITLATFAIVLPDNTASKNDTSNPRRRVNVPYTPVNAGVPAGEQAVFWFGEVDSTSNYVDVRTIYDDDSLSVTLHIFDRWLWYNETPSASDLAEWDAASLYLDLTGSDEPVLSPDSFHFVAQVNHWQEDEAYQTAYRAYDSIWAPADVPFTATTDWRGVGFNGPEARGWVVTFAIPFQSLALSGAPDHGTIWRLAISVHDRDDATDSPIPDQQWPTTMQSTQPSSWGELHFGLPFYHPPFARSEGITTVRHGLDGAVVPDAHVGGHTICGQQFSPDFFDGWGDANYAGYEQANIQNQWDVADWPCFSKYYATFPLDFIPRDKTIISAKLTLHQFGNAGQGLDPSPQESLIQVLTVTEEWGEFTLTWNNAPLAGENVARSWVAPIEEAVDWPGIARDWDLTYAVTRAYIADEPLRLALYSADAVQNSGKYFTTSDTGDWNAEGRPTLTVVWGSASDSQSFLFLPLLERGY